MHFFQILEYYSFRFIVDILFFVLENRRLLIKDPSIFKAILTDFITERWCKKILVRLIIELVTLLIHKQF